MNASVADHYVEPAPQLQPGSSTLNQNIIQISSPNDDLLKKLKLSEEESCDCTFNIQLMFGIVFVYLVIESCLAKLYC